MTIFRMTVQATAEIEEIWEAEAETAEIAEDSIGTGDARFVSDRVIGEERDREVSAVEIVPAFTAEPSANGPYRPELAEAFRQGARDLQLDCLDIPFGAQVEEGEGGAYVTCRVYVSDAARPLMPGEDS